MVINSPKTFGLYRINLNFLEFKSNSLGIYNKTLTGDRFNSGNCPGDMRKTHELSNQTYVVLVIDINQYWWFNKSYFGIHVIGKDFAGYINTDNIDMRNTMELVFEKL